MEKLNIKSIQDIIERASWYVENGSIIGNDFGPCIIKGIDTSKVEPYINGVVTGLELAGYDTEGLAKMVGDLAITKGIERVKAKERKGYSFNEFINRVNIK